VGAGWLVLLLLAVSPAQAATIVVTSNADDMTANGNCTLREALEAANTDTAVDACAPGAGPDLIRFRPTLQDATILLTSGMLRVDSDVTLHGGSLNVSLDAAGASRVLVVESGATAEIINLTLTGGYAAGPGSGVRNRGTLMLTGSAVTGNQSTGSILGFGGGIFNEGGLLTLSESAICDNAAEVFGGGLYNNATGEVLLLDSVVCDNQTGGVDFGGGIVNLGTLTLERCIVRGNTSGFGGGIFNDGTMTVEQSTVRANESTSSSIGIGGGILNSGVMTLARSTVSDNDAGGIYNDGTLTLEQSTVSGNRAEGGAGILTSGLQGDGALALTQSTVSNNEAEVDGGGVFVAGGARLQTRGSIISGNIDAGLFNGADLITDPFTPPTITSGGYNLIGDVSTRNLSDFNEPGDLTGVTDPGLGPLSDNGGPTETMLPLPGSAALDASDAAICISAEDQRGPGFPRARDGDGDGTATCDIGATEAPTTPLPGYALLLMLPPGHLPPPASIATLRAPVAGADDFDNDGVPEIVVESKDPQGNSTLTAFTAATGTEVWSATSADYGCWPQNGRLRGFLNTDDDPNVEAILGGEGTLVIDTTTGKADFCLDDTYRHLAEQDVDGNGTLALIVVDTQMRQIQAWGWQ
jgi:CSLREA domain-containing protein